MNCKHERGKKVYIENCKSSTRTIYKCKHCDKYIDVRILRFGKLGEKVSIIDEVPKKPTRIMPKKSYFGGIKGR